MSASSPVNQEKKHSEANDAHWDAAVPARGRTPPKAVQAAYKHCQYESVYVEMRDGVRIAIDVTRPPAGRFDESRGLPCVLLQTRYQRSTRARWPIKKLLNGRPLDLLSQEAKQWFLAAGYAVCAVDVRGTGASFGRWRAPWAAEERTDSREIVEWMVQQPWSNKQVVLWGVSYDGTVALFTTAEQHTAVVAAAPQYAFWDLYADIALPGGIALHSFVSVWTKHCIAMDSNDLSRLPQPHGTLVPLVTRGCQPVVEGVRLGQRGSSKADGGEGKDGRKTDRLTAKRQGLAALREAVAGHDTWQAATDLAEVRCIDDVAPVADIQISSVSACSVADRIASAGVPLFLTAGWLDSTAAPAIHIFCNAAKAPGSKLLIGPWGHGGNMHCRLAESTATRSTFSQPLSCIQFFDQACNYRPLGRSADVFGPRFSYGSRKRHDSSVPNGTSHSNGRGHTNGDTAALRNGADAVSDTAAGQQNGKTANGSQQRSPRNGSSAACGDQRHHVESEPCVRYFVMGCRPHWKASHSWLPHDLAPAPRQLFLGGGDVASPASSAASSSPVAFAAPSPAGGGEANGSRQTAPPQAGEPSGVDAAGRGSMTDAAGAAAAEVPREQHGTLLPAAPAQGMRWQQQVDKSLFLTGKSRYDVITQPKATIQYHRLRRAGHTFYTGEPLAAELQIVGWVTVDVWVASSDAEADIFCYLEDYDPERKKARYVTEGQFRASHRAEPAGPSDDDPRRAAHLPGAPFHTFRRADQQPLSPGVPVRCRFQLLPTAYGFARGHCVRVAFAGADAKHFSPDFEGRRTMWILSGGSTPSVVSLPEMTPDK